MAPAPEDDCRSMKSLLRCFEVPTSCSATKLSACDRTTHSQSLCFVDYIDITIMRLKLCFAQNLLQLQGPRSIGSGPGRPRAGGGVGKAWEGVRAEFLS